MGNTIAAKLIILIGILLFLSPYSISMAQNCCAPAVPQQGVLGETVALPNTLELGLHYEMLSSKKLYEGCCQTDNKTNKKAYWKRASLTASYGIFRRLSVGITVPYTWKENSWDVLQINKRIKKSSNGIGDITTVLRFSLLPRDFVNYRELSMGVGLKIPTGATDCLDDQDFLLAEELQPGTGSWDYHVSLSFYQGFEPVDFTISGTYVITSEHEGYEFGNQFYYLLSSNFHIKERLDLSAAISGTMRDKDVDDGTMLENTGRHQLWFTPGIQYQLISEKLRIQSFIELPVYQHLDGTQLGGSYNIRLSVACLIPLKKSD